MDVGLIDFVVTSDGSKYTNPKHIKKHSKNLKRKQQKLSRKQKGSKVSKMPLNVRHWDCPKCLSRNDRDINAAKNIRDEALRVLALGTNAAASGGNVSRGGKASVLSDAVSRETGSPRHSGVPLDGG